MAKKKPSGFQRKKLSRMRAKLSGIIPFAPPKRGRPKGITTQHQKLQEHLRKELAWLGMPHKADLALAKLLSMPRLREEYLLNEITPHRGEAYQGIKERAFRREIAIAQRYVWGGPKIRSLPLQHKARLNNFGQKNRPR
jgi:hypothetical protein